jgi:hypothetical protein
MRPSFAHRAQAVVRLGLWALLVSAASLGLGADARPAHAHAATEPAAESLVAGASTSERPAVLPEARPPRRAASPAPVLLVPAPILTAPAGPVSFTYVGSQALHIAAGARCRGARSPPIS